MNNQNYILIVDDIELNRAILGELFYEKYQVLEAVNGEEAIALLTQYGESISIVLLDIIMPILGGFGVLQYMIDSGSSGRIPVVMITSEISVDIIQKSFAMGACDVISKPFSPNIIQQRISNIVEQYDYKRHLEKLVNEQTSALRAQSDKLRENSSQIIDVLSAVIEFKNMESVSHIQHIRTITHMLMIELMHTHSEYNLTEELAEIVSQAAAMHDIGKIGIPDNILNYPGKLSHDDLEIMKTHTIKGCEILEKLYRVQRMENYGYCYEICRHHHERWDGNGYPDGLSGDTIPIWAQVVSIADVYDALISKRVYKDAFSSETAVSMILNGECGMFNPILIQCFLKIVKNFIADDSSLVGMAHNSDSIEQKPLTLKKGEDISLRTLRLLELERQKYHIMSELSGEILFEYDLETDTLLFSEKYHLYTGKSLKMTDASKTIISDNMILREDFDKLEKSVLSVKPSSAVINVEVKINFEKMNFCWYQVLLFPLWSPDDETKCIGFLGKLLNVDEQKQKSIELQFAATRDSLTDLFNGKTARTKIDEYIKSNFITGGALCFIDIDNFKLVNDNFGHLFGDVLLKKMAKVLKDNCRDKDVVGRMGGDEFLIMFGQTLSPEEIQKRFEKITREINSVDEEYHASLSMGVSNYPTDGINFETLLNCADQALYTAKRLGKNQCWIYNSKN